MAFVDTSHPEIMRGFSDPTEVDLEQARQGTVREREWHEDTPGFATTQDILDAAVANKLAKINETLLYRPATRFINPDLEAIYPPYLPFAAEALLELISTRWRERAGRLGVSSEVRLSVTSMARSIAYQRELVAGGKLAVDDSTHTKVTGGAVDIDLGGYYQGFGKGLRAVSLRTAEQRAPISKVFIEKLGAKPITPPAVDPSEFDHRVPGALRTVVEELHNEGLMNRLEEFPGTKNNVLHMAPHPDFIALVMGRTA